MARPTKLGLDYFPLDVDIDQDDKVALVEAKYGAEGFAIVIKLFMRIYKNNYYYKWGEIEQLLFSKRVNVDINQVIACINDCVKWGLFDESMYKTYEILTSAGIQRRYLEAVGRRQKAEIIKEYLTLEPDDINSYKNISLKSINVNNNSVNADIYPQSKVKENKVNKTNNNRHKKTYDDQSPYYLLAEYFFKKIKENSPGFKQPNLQEWANCIRLISKNDGRAIEQIRYLIDWSQADSFWKGNILSPQKLRKQFDRLIIQINENQKKKNHSIQPKGPMLSIVPVNKQPNLTDKEIEEINNLQKEMPL